jgi:hypothetical protein
MNRDRKLRAWPNICLFTWTILLIFYPSNQSEQQATQLKAMTGNIPVHAPAHLAVGEALLINIGPVDAPDGMRVTLEFDTSVGQYFAHLSLRHKMATHTFTGAATQQAGISLVTAQAGQAYGEAYVTIAPSEAIEPIYTFVGPSNIPINSNQSADIVVLAFDRYGNVVADGSNGTVTIQRPNGSLTISPIVTSHLIAQLQVTSGTVTGNDSIAATIGNATGAATSLTETSGQPTAFTLTASPTILPADGNSQITIKTSVIRDRFGNMLSDGTLVTFTLTEEDGTRITATSYTLSGIAQIAIQAPKQAGKLQIIGSIYGLETTPIAITLTAGPAVGNIPINITLDPNLGTITLNVGPIISALGGFIADGLPVACTVTDNIGRTIAMTGHTYNGLASIVMRSAPLKPGAIHAACHTGAGAGEASFQLP